MGSDSDLPVVEKAMTTLEEFGVPYEVHVYSAHRTPAEVKEFTQNARTNGFGAIIAAAGKAAHLAGSIAASTTLPVIGIPVKSSTLDGLDALYPQCRCLAEFRWQLSRLMVRRMRLSWLFRCLASKMRRSHQNWTTREKRRLKKFWLKIRTLRKNIIFCNK